MLIRVATVSIALCLFLASCNLDATNDDGEEPPPGEETHFQLIESSGLPATTTSAKAADIDGNGAQDLVLALDQYSNAILMNDGYGGFSEDTDRLPSDQYEFQTRDIAIADFNVDGYPDLLFVSDQPDAYELYINSPQGYFTDFSNRIPVSDNATAVAAWDFDENGTTDILIGTVRQNVLLTNNGNGVFSNQTEARLPTYTELTTDIEIVDVTADGNADILTSSESSVRILQNDGSGIFVDQSDQLLPFSPAAEETYALAVGDINGDSLPDIYTGNAGEEAEAGIRDRLLINQGEGIFADETDERLPDSTFATADAEMVDLNNNGNLDLIIGRADSGGLQVLMNNGNGRYSDSTRAWVPSEVISPVNDVEVADVNYDQLPDLFISVQDGPDLLLLQQ